MSTLNRWMRMYAPWVEQDEREMALAEIEAMFEQEERTLRLTRGDGVGCANGAAYYPEF